MADADSPKCKACGCSSRDAFCRRCWKLAPLWGRFELAWFFGEFRGSTEDADLMQAYASWQITANWLAGLIRAELQRRQARRVVRRGAPRRQPKTLAQLADEADARA